MNPNEFRLGNWVLDENENWIQIKELNLNSKYKPIILEKETLWVWGFRKFGKNGDFVKNNFFLHNRKRGLVINKKFPIVKYLHQLQNIYFYSKQEELW